MNSGKYLDRLYKVEKHDNRKMYQRCVIKWEYLMLKQHISSEVQSRCVSEN